MLTNAAFRTLRLSGYPTRKPTRSPVLVRRNYSRSYDARPTPPLSLILPSLCFFSEGADFTDAVMNTPLMKKMCALPTAKGTNPTTGVDTRDSLICPE